MIGVITEDNIYPLLLDIANTKKVNIYWYKSNDLKTGVEKLKERNCNIIITDQDSTIIKDSSIKFININCENKLEDYIIDSEELLAAIKNRDEKQVIEILKKLDIPKEKNILIINPTILYIKHIIEELYTNKIETITDLITNKIEVTPKEIGEIYLIN